MKKKLMLVLGAMMTLASPLFAETGETATLGLALSAGLAIGIAAFGGALAQGRAAAAALEGIARNPNAADRLLMPMILGLALIESLVIYGLVIALMLVFKIA